MEAIYNQKRNTVPLQGGWVTIKGNPYAKRGLRIPSSIRDEGVRHMDVYWGYNEECPWKLSGKLNKLADEEIVDDVLYLHGISDMQLTKLTIHTPSSLQTCFWAGELALFSDQLISMLQEEGWLQTIPFGGLIEHPIWDEETRDILGSLMMDGLNLYQAQNEIILAGLKLPEFVKPNHFYRPVGTYYDSFCEEPEYEAWWSPGSRIRAIDKAKEETSEQNLSSLFS
jgi:hypothetical protein